MSNGLFAFLLLLDEQPFSLYGGSFVWLFLLVDEEGRDGRTVGRRWGYEPLRRAFLLEVIGCLWWGLLVSLEMELEERRKS